MDGVLIYVLKGRISNHKLNGFQFRNSFCALPEQNTDRSRLTGIEY